MRFARNEGGATVRVLAGTAAFGIGAVGASAVVGEPAEEPVADDAGAAVIDLEGQPVLVRVDEIDLDDEIDDDLDDVEVEPTPATPDTPASPDTPDSPETPDSTPTAPTPKTPDSPESPASP